MCCVLCLLCQSCPTLCEPMDCSPLGSSVYGDAPGKNTRVGCHALLQVRSPWGDAKCCSGLRQGLGLPAHPLGTPVRLVPAVCSPSAPPPLAFQCPGCAGGGTRASPAVWEDRDCIPPYPCSPTTPGLARNLPWGPVSH